MRKPLTWTYYDDDETWLSQNESYGDEVWAIVEDTPGLSYTLFDWADKERGTFKTPEEAQDWAEIHRKDG